MVSHKSYEGGDKISQRAVRAVDLINYHDDAVVSRTLIDKETGTVTLFAFDRGRRLSEHTAPFDALVSVLEGRAEVIIDGRAFCLQTGEMIIMPANKPHALKATERFKMMLIMIRQPQSGAGS